MKKFSVAIIALLGVSPFASALDLTPHEMVSSSDGPPMKRYFFEDQSKQLSFRIDNKMAISGGRDSVAFRFNDLQSAAMKISRSQTPPAVVFNEKNFESYRTTARTILAPEVTNVQLEEEVPNAISINRWTSHQFVFTYNLFGAAYRRSITFLNYSETEQFIVDVTSLADDYPKAYGRGYRVINSLTDLPVVTGGPT